jgi:hypothetical protein
MVPSKLKSNKMEHVQRRRSVHPLDFPFWLRALHFCNILFVTLLIRSGLEILSAHPKLYWNDDCIPGSAWLRLGRGIPGTGQLAPTPQFGHAAIAVSATPDRKTAEFSNKELSMAAALIKAYEGKFDPTQFKDLY